MTRRLLLCPAQLVVCATAFAMPPTVAHWKVSSQPKAAQNAGSVFTVGLTAQIEPGWHLYALEEPEGGPQPTQIGLAEGDPLTLLAVNEPKPRQVLDPSSKAMAGLFTESVTFTLRVRAPRGVVVADAVSHILVRYQSCNDQVCLPPRTETINMPLNGLLR